MTVVASLDFTKYPYDFQNINITVGSWLYFDERISYRLRKLSDGTIDGLEIQNINNWKLENLEWDFKTSSIEQVILNQT